MAEAESTLASTFGSDGQTSSTDACSNVPRENTPRVMTSSMSAALMRGSVSAPRRLSSATTAVHATEVHADRPSTPNVYWESPAMVILGTSAMWERLRASTRSATGEPPRAMLPALVVLGRMCVG